MYIDGLDEVDNQILTILSENARMSFSEILESRRRAAAHIGDILVPVPLPVRSGLGEIGVLPERTLRTGTVIPSHALL